MEKRHRLNRYGRSYLYRTAAGVVPFTKWYEKLDAKTRARIFRRLERIEYYDEWGSYRMLTGNHLLMALKFHFGPGYRIYCQHLAGGLVVFLGGDKSSQKRDIQLAQK